jgi:hypothetical protein
MPRVNGSVQVWGAARSGEDRVGERLKASPSLGFPADAGKLRLRPFAPRAWLGE